MATPNQANTVAVNATAISQPLRRLAANVVLDSSASSQGTHMTKPSSQACPPRAYTPASTALATSPAQACQRKRTPRTLFRSANPVTGWVAGCLIRWIGKPGGAMFGGTTMSAGSR